MRSVNDVSTRPISVLRRGAIGAVASLTLLACGGDGSDGDGESFPEVDVVTLDDGTVSTSSWIGEPLVVNFWYSTCVPCAKELGEFAEVDAETDEVRFIGVNPLDEIDTMTDFASERGVTYDLVRDPLADLQIALEITSFPATVFVTSDGEIVEMTGVLDADGLRGEIDDLLAADSAA